MKLSTIQTEFLFENENIIGSISFSNGGAIDDFTFKNYNEKLMEKKKLYY